MIIRSNTLSTPDRREMSWDKYLHKIISNVYCVRLSLPEISRK